MPTPISQTSNRPTASNLMLEARARESETGATLLELERRQDDVLSQLDDLDQKLNSILLGLGVNLTEQVEASSPSIRLADLGDDSDENEPLSSSKYSDAEHEVTAPRYFDRPSEVTRRKAA